MVLYHLRPGALLKRLLLRLAIFVGAFVNAAAQEHTFEAVGKNSFLREGYTKAAKETRELINNFK